MSIKQKWPLVILISSMQLAILLLAVVFLFDWFNKKTAHTLLQQVNADNKAIAEQTIVATEIPRIPGGFSESDKTSVNKIQRHIDRIKVPNDGLIAILSTGEGRTIAHSNERESTAINWGALNLIDGEESMNLANAVSSSNPTRSGKVKTQSGEYCLSATMLPGNQAIMIVAQQRSRSMREHFANVATMRKLVFAATLLFGFFCVGYSTTILSRFNEQVSNTNLQLEKQVSKKTRELVRTRNAVIFGLAKLAESRDNDTGEHLERIRIYVTLLAQDLSSQYPILDEDFVHNLGLASSLHDIGKVGIPDSILLKPGRLTPEERGVMELHTLIGGECLDAIQERLGNNEFMEIARQVTYSHHERWDGTGYPHKLAGNDIPLIARIVSVADVYDALTSKRPYKRAMSHTESRAIICSGSGTQFDPEVVAAFLRHEDEFERISIQQQALTDDESKSDFQRRVEQFDNGQPEEETAIKNTPGSNE